VLILEVVGVGVTGVVLFVGVTTGVCEGIAESVAATMVAILSSSLSCGEFVDVVAHPARAINKVA